MSRLLFALADVEYEDERIESENWPKMKPGEELFCKGKRYVIVGFVYDNYDKERVIVCRAYVFYLTESIYITNRS